MLGRNALKFLKERDQQQMPIKDCLSGWGGWGGMSAIRSEVNIGDHLSSNRARFLQNFDVSPCKIIKKVKSKEENKWNVKNISLQEGLLLRSYPT